MTVPADWVEEFFACCDAEPELVDHYEDCGVSWVRQDSRWEQTELEPGEFDFSHWDEYAEVFGGRGLTLLPILDYTAEWAADAPDDATGREADHSPAADPADWQEYVRRFVERYDHLDHFEVWNEPNLSHFLYADEPNKEAYVERVLEPAAEVLHARDKKVVAPTFTTEWVPGVWDDGRPGNKWDPDEVADVVSEWLAYRDAYERIDYLSVHYTKGDTEKREIGANRSMMAFYDRMYEEWVEPGKIDGIWNTEEGHTATGAGDSGFVALEPWERKPYAQWAPRYTLPTLYWALDGRWDHRHQYKVFWFSMGYGRGALEPHNLVEKTEDGFEPTDTARALHTASTLLTDADQVGAYDGTVEAGLGLYSIEEGGPANDRNPYEFTSYGFTLDDDLLAVAWLDLPGIDLAAHQSEDSKIQLRTDADVSSATAIHWLTREETETETEDRPDAEGTRIRVPRTGAPVLYVRAER